MPTDRPHSFAWNAHPDTWNRPGSDGPAQSPRAITDAAIVEAVASGLPPGGRVLDAGCGDGWLARALAAMGAVVHGIDADPAQIEAARTQGQATFAVLAYEMAATDPALLGGPFDAVVFNDSLPGDRIRGTLRAAAESLDVGGRVLIHTAHPVALAMTYEDGWHEPGTTLGGGYATTDPQYRRTFAGWLAELDAVGLRLAHCREPRHPETGAPLSLILDAERL